MELREILLKYREENKLSQREFARRCGLSNSLISILEMGVNPQTGKKMAPDLETYRKLASEMGMTVQALFELLGDSESVDISEPPSPQEELDSYRAETREAQILARGMDKMTEDQRKRLLDLVNIAFNNQFIDPEESAEKRKKWPKSGE